MPTRWFNRQLKNKSRKLKKNLIMYFPIVTLLLRETYLAKLDAWLTVCDSNWILMYVAWTLNIHVCYLIGPFTAHEAFLTPPLYLFNSLSLRCILTDLTDVFKLVNVIILLNVQLNNSFLYIYGWGFELLQPQLFYLSCLEIHKELKHSDPKNHNVSNTVIHFFRSAVTVSVWINKSS